MRVCMYLEEHTSKEACTRNTNLADPTHANSRLETRHENQLVKRLHTLWRLAIKKETAMINQEKPTKLILQRAEWDCALSYISNVEGSCSRRSVSRERQREKKYAGFTPFFYYLTYFVIASRSWPCRNCEKKTLQEET